MAGLKMSLVHIEKRAYLGTASSVIKFCLGHSDDNRVSGRTVALRMHSIGPLTSLPNVYVQIQLRVVSLSIITHRQAPFNVQPFLLSPTRSPQKRNTFFTPSFEFLPQNPRVPAGGRGESALFWHNSPGLKGEHKKTAIR